MEIKTVNHIQGGGGGALAAQTPPPAHRRIQEQQPPSMPICDPPLPPFAVEKPVLSEECSLVLAHLKDQVTQDKEKDTPLMTAFKEHFKSSHSSSLSKTLKSYLTFQENPDHTTQLQALNDFIEAGMFSSVVDASDADSIFVATPDEKAAIQRRVWDYVFPKAEQLENQDDYRFLAETYTKVQASKQELFNLKQAVDDDRESVVLSKNRMTRFKRIYNTNNGSSVTRTVQDLLAPQGDQTLKQMYAALHDFIEEGMVSSVVDSSGDDDSDDSAFYDDDAFTLSLDQAAAIKRRVWNYAFDVSEGLGNPNNHRLLAMEYTETQASKRQDEKAARAIERKAAFDAKIAAGNAAARASEASLSASLCIKELQGIVPPVSFATSGWRNAPLTHNVINVGRSDAFTRSAPNQTHLNPYLAFLETWIPSVNRALALPLVNALGGAGGGSAEAMHDEPTMETTSLASLIEAIRIDHPEFESEFREFCEHYRTESQSQHHFRATVQHGEDSLNTLRQLKAKAKAAAGDAENALIGYLTDSDQGTFHELSEAYPNVLSLKIDTTLPIQEYSDDDIARMLISLCRGDDVNPEMDKDPYRSSQWQELKKIAGGFLFLYHYNGQKNLAETVRELAAIQREMTEIPQDPAHRAAVDVTAFRNHSLAAADRGTGGGRRTASSDAANARRQHNAGLRQAGIENCCRIC